MSDEIIIMNPSQDDAKDIYNLIKNSKPLDLNSQYLYILQATYFNDTCLVAKYHEKIIGFVSGFIHPKDNKVFFVWQVAVNNDFRGKNIAFMMLEKLFDSQKLSDIQSIHTTISPSNTASEKVFKKLATRLQLDMEISIFAKKEEFESSHEDELLYILKKRKLKRNNMRIFENYESEVRGYIRSFPTIFEQAKGAKLIDEQGVEYIDFFAGAGTLNYGHNNQKASQAMIEYLQKDGIVHGLDMATSAKKAFIEKFVDTILKPRNLEYKLQFTGPTGTNAVETALKLARLIKGRSNIVAFTNAYHGLSQGSLSVTGNNFYRDESHISRSNVTFMPFDGYLGENIDSLSIFRKLLEDNSSGLDAPAAVILETVQGEGGINVATKKWLQGIESLCREFDMLLIVDDIQVGNGRVGEFFSFEFANINPDIVTLSKSIGGGLPMALVLMKPELDQWKPGEHTGTFRGNNLAFVASTRLLEYWDNDDLANAISYKEDILKKRLEKIALKYPEYNINVRGRGLVYGMEIAKDCSVAGEISKKAFENRLIIETCGSSGQVVKFLPPLTIDEDILLAGLDIFESTVDAVMETKKERLTKEF